MTEGEMGQIPLEPKFLLLEFYHEAEFEQRINNREAKFLRVGNSSKDSNFLKTQVVILSQLEEKMVEQTQ